MKKNFMTGMGMGLAVGACAAYAMIPKRRRNKLNKTLLAVEDMVSAVCDQMGL